MELASVDAGPSVDAVDYSTFTSAIDLMAVHKRDIQGIRIVTATGTSTITVTLPEQTADRVLTVVQGEFLPIRARAIVAVSDVTLLRVYWGRY